MAGKSLRVTRLACCCLLVAYLIWRFAGTIADTVHITGVSDSIARDRVNEQFLCYARYKVYRDFCKANVICGTIEL